MPSALHLMLVKMLTGVAGVRFAHDPDDIIDIDDALAKRYIAAGAAVAAGPAVKTKQTKSRGKKQETSATRETTALV